MTLSIIIVSFNAREDLERCLALAARGAAGDRARHHRRRQRVDRRRPAEIRARWPGTQVIELERNLGFAAGNNVGIRATQRRASAALEQRHGRAAWRDRRARRTAARRSHHCGSRPGRGSSTPTAGAGAVVRGDDLAARRAAAEGRRPPSTAQVSPGRDRGSSRTTRSEQLRRLGQRRLPAGPAADAEAVGLLDERFFLYTEDVDFCAQLRARGRRVAVHAGRRSRAPSRALARKRAGGDERRLSPQPDRVLREASSALGAGCCVPICASKAPCRQTEPCLCPRTDKI